MKKFKEFRSDINELNGQTGPVLKISYKPQRAGGKLTSHSTITKSDLYEDIVYNNKHWKITENTNSLAFRLPHPKGDERDRKHFMDLINSAKGDVSNLIRGGGLTRSEVQELKRDYEKAIKVFKGTNVVSQDHEIYVAHDKPGKLKVKEGDVLFVPHFVKIGKLENSTVFHFNVSYIYAGVEFLPVNKGIRKSIRKLFNTYK